MSTDASPFLRTTPADAVLVDTPIPAGDVLAGTPVARSTGLTYTKGDGMAVGVWECTAGRFNWRYTADETICIVSGEARVTDAEGRTVVLREGDWATFRAGDTAMWDIADHVRKTWVHARTASMPAKVLRRSRVVHARHGLVKPVAALSGSAGLFGGVVAVMPI